MDFFGLSGENRRVEERRAPSSHTFFSLFLLLLLSSIPAVSAETVVEFTGSPSVVNVGEPVKFTLNIKTTEELTGGVEIRQKTDAGEQKLVKRIYSRSGCACTGGPVRGLESRELSFVPDMPGDYVAVSGFGGAKEVEFKVVGTASSGGGEAADAVSKEAEPSTSILNPHVPDKRPDSIGGSMPPVKNDTFPANNYSKTTIQQPSTTVLSGQESAEAAPEYNRGGFLKMVGVVVFGFLLLYLMKRLLK